MFKRIFTGIYRLIWYTFAFIVLNAAVVVTAVRIALPEIGAYKDEIQSWVSEYMDYPVTIESINAEWQGWTPHLYLKNIDLFTQDDGQLITKFESAHVGINLLNSLIEREITPNYLSISGLNLEFNRKPDGSIAISSDSVYRLNTGDASEDKALSEWLFKQKHIIINDAVLTWHDEKSNADSIIFSNVLIDLRTDNNRTQLNASVNLPERFGDQLNINMDVYGNILSTEWKGDIYIEALNVTNPTALFEKPLIQTRHGNGDLHLWTNWSKARLNHFNAALEYEQFSLIGKSHSLPVNQIHAKLRGNSQHLNDWQIDVQLEKLETANGNWPKTEFQFLTQKNVPNNKSEYNLFLPYLKLDDTLPFLSDSPYLPDSLIKFIELKTVKGELLNLLFSVIDDMDSLNKFNLDTQFQNFSISSSDEEFSVSGLDGHTSIDNESIRLMLDSKFTDLKVKKLFNKAISFTQIESDLEISNNENPEIKVNNIKLTSDDINLNGSGLIQTDHTSPFIDFVLHLDSTPIDKVPSYLPNNIDPELKEWLTQALVAGNILSGDMIYRGHTSDYPFRNSEGQFKTILSIDNGTLDYKEGWPLIYNINADIVFENDNVVLSSEYGQIFDAEIKTVTARIDNLGRENLNVLVDGIIHGHTSDAINVIQQSPLNENESLKELADLHIAGNLELNLKLDIPLDERLTSVDGLMTFENVSMESSMLGLGLEEINGDTQFTRDEFWADELDALYHGEPVILSIPKTGKDENELDVLRISGTADKNFIINEINTFFPALFQTSNDIDKYVNGESEWSINIEKRKDQNGNKLNDIEISSNLAGIEINLPYPIGKLRHENKTVYIKTQIINKAISRFDIDYNNNVFTDIIVDNSRDLTVKKILIGLGKTHSIDESMNDISIEGELAQLNINEWISFNDSRKEQMPVNNQESKLISSNVFINNLNLMNHDFKDVILNINNKDTGWSINLDSNQIKGHAGLSDNNKLTVKLDHLYIEKDKENKVENDNKININNLPELDVKVKQMFYNNNDYGKFSLVTTNSENGIIIDKLMLNKPDLKIDAQGVWTQINNVDRSEFNFTLNSDSVDSMFKTFGYDSANIKDGASNFLLKASWMDTPLNFSMAKVDGVLDMKIGKGQFLDINPSAGRLFGLLSIQTLPRRLLLDFSDLFGEGFSFDSIEGNFSLQQGHAYTNNLEMVGPAADIVVSGRTGFISEDYDQIATVTPKVSNTIPVASALFGPVGVGVGAVIYLVGEIFESIPKQFNKILSYQYSITGSWDNPDIEKIKESPNG